MNNLILVTSFLMVAFAESSFAMSSYTVCHSDYITRETIDSRIELFLKHKLGVEAIEIVEIQNISQNEFIPVKFRVLAAVAAPLAFQSFNETLESNCSLHQGLFTSDKISYLKGDKECSLVLDSKFKSNILDFKVNSVVKQRNKPKCVLI